LTTTGTLTNAQEVLDRISSGEYPDSQVLDGVPLVRAWSVIPGDDLYRIGGIIASSSEGRTRPRIVPLPAIDRRGKWALTIVDHQVIWWLLDDPLPGALPVDPADVRCRTTTWVRRWLHGA